MGKESQIEATTRLVIEVDGAVTRVKIHPWLDGAVDCSRQLSIGMRAETKTADIARGGKPESAGKRPAGEVDMISHGNQRIDPIG